MSILRKTDGAYKTLRLVLYYWSFLVQVVFNRTGDVIFGVSLEQEMEDETKYETSFRTFDAGDYSQIATIETKKSVLNLCSSLDDCHLAVIEQVRTDSLS